MNTGTTSQSDPLRIAPSIVVEPAPVWKRTLDIVCCVITLPLLALLTLAMAILTKIVSPGPVFFTQNRVGLGGKLFRIYKFRTMRVNTNPNQHKDHFKNLVDSRAPMEKLESKNNGCLITGGRLLRISGLDELPQVINVLRGEMSLVGPRPCMPYEFSLYGPARHKRFETPPGLTGLWQVSGKNRTTFDQMVELDIDYVRRRSLGLDIWIMAMTIPALAVQMNDSRRARRTSAPHSRDARTVDQTEFVPDRSPRKLSYGTEHSDSHSHSRA